MMTLGALCGWGLQSERGSGTLGDPEGSGTARVFLVVRNQGENPGSFEETLGL